MCGRAVIIQQLLLAYFIYTRQIYGATAIKPIALFPVPCPHAFFGPASGVVIKLISRETTTRADGVHIKCGC